MCPLVLVGHNMFSEVVHVFLLLRRGALHARRQLSRDLMTEHVRMAS